MEFAGDIAGGEEADGFAEAEGHEEEGAGKCGKSHTVNDDCAELPSGSAIDLEVFEVAVGMRLTNETPLLGTTHRMRYIVDQCIIFNKLLNHSKIS